MTENIIQFPGQTPADEPPAESPQPINWENLSENQVKAVQIILGGMDFVCIGIKPTGSGADFFTAVHGDDSALSDALPHLDGVIQRAYQRRGL